MILLAISRRLSLKFYIQKSVFIIEEPKSWGIWFSMSITGTFYLIKMTIRQLVSSAFFVEVKDIAILFLCHFAVLDEQNVQAIVSTKTNSKTSKILVCGYSHPQTSLKQLVTNLFSIFMVLKSKTAD